MTGGPAGDCCGIPGRFAKPGRGYRGRFAKLGEAYRGAPREAEPSAFVIVISMATRRGLGRG